MNFYDEERPSHVKRYTMALTVVFLLWMFIIGIAFFSYYSLTNFMDQAREEGTQSILTDIEKDCKKYMSAHNGQPPVSLAELVEPSDGGKPTREGGKASLNSVWNDGSQYSYDPTHLDAIGNFDPIVYLKRPDGRILYASGRVDWK